MQATKPTHVRYLILLMLFLVTTINYADRATIAIAGSSLQKDLGIDAVTLGYIFSAFGWAYVAGQIPGGWLLDRFGSKKVYALSIFTWSVFTVLQGYVGEFGVSTAVVALFMLRFMVGLAEAPSCPGNARIVAAWFPTAERGTASAIFNSAQYFATVLFAPLMGWIVYRFGWQHVFIVMGVIGVLFSLIWLLGPRLSWLFIRLSKEPRVQRLFERIAIRLRAPLPSGRVTILFRPPPAP